MVEYKIKLSKLLVVQNVYQCYEQASLITRRPVSERKRVTTVFRYPQVCGIEQLLLFCCEINSKKLEIHQIVVNGPLEVGFVLLGCLVEGWLQVYPFFASIELQDWLLPEITCHVMMRTGLFPMSHVYGKELEMDMLQFVLTSDFHLAVGRSWFGGESRHKHAQSWPSYRIAYGLSSTTPTSVVLRQP